jgi:hypothetical protein
MIRDVEIVVERIASPETHGVCMVAANPVKYYRDPSLNPQPNQKNDIQRDKKIPAHY